MSRLIRPVVLAALLITSIHLRKTRDTFLEKKLCHAQKVAVEEGAATAVPLALSLPLKGVLALSPEEVNVGLELQLEDVILVDAV